jgi:hypothetical protein
MRVVTLVLMLSAAPMAVSAQQRTPWGDPDLQGIWSNQTRIPLERPPALAGKATLRLVERFARLDPDTIRYRLTVSDPATFSRPWTLENALRKSDGPLYEVACHEGNYGLAGILSGARAEENRAKQ